LYDHFGHMFCGVYVHVTREGEVAPGDACSQPQPETTADAPRAGAL
jgi:uncharacterized protein